MRNAVPMPLLSTSAPPRLRPVARHRQGATLFVIIVLALASTALPADLFVAVGGSSTGDGTDPDNPISIERALEIADPATKILLQQGTYPIINSVSLTQSQSFEGGWNTGFTERTDDPTVTVFDGDGTTDRVILWDPGDGSDTLTIENVTIQDGNAENAAVQPGYGGGIYTTGGTLTLRDAIIQANTGRANDVGSGEDAAGFGGGIYASGALIIENSLITNNVGTASVRPGGGFFRDAGGAGGGIMVGYDPNVDPNATVTITNSTISNNAANTALDEISARGNTEAHGGGISIEPHPGTSISGSPEMNIFIDLSGVTVSDNDAKLGDETALAKGGGIYLDFSGVTVSGSSSVVISDSTISGNDASGTNFGFFTFGSTAEGGGIWSGQGTDQTVTITNSTITDNNADGLGGNQFGTGGGIYNQGGSVTITDSVISGNVASFDGDGGRGGGIDIIDANATITRNTITDNVAADEPFVPPTADGAGLFIGQSEPGVIVVTNNIFDSNFTTQQSSTDTRGESVAFQLDPTTIIILYHNTFQNINSPDRSAIFVDSGIPDIQNNIISGTDIGVLAGAGLTTGNVNFNIFNDVETQVEDPSGNLTVGTSNATGDPGFVSSGTGDFHLQPTSIARDTGNPTLGVTDDRDGNVRDETPDKGAHEYQAPEVFYDFGDAPDSYSTLLASDGPRHLINLPQIAVRLGDIDEEDDGQPTLDANGDDNNGSSKNDEADIVFSRGVLSPCVDANYVVSGEPTVILAKTRGSGFLSLWMDTNRNGVFDHPAELFIDDEPSNGGNTDTSYSFNPGTFDFDRSYVRVRYSSQQDLTPTGEAPDGEVEDYLVTRLKNANHTLDMKVEFSPGDPLDKVEVDEPFTVTLTVTNNGPEDLEGASIFFRIGEVFRNSANPSKLESRDVLPQFTTSPTMVPTGTTLSGTGMPSTDPLQWDITTMLAPMESVSVQFMAELEFPGPGTVVSYQFVTGQLCATTSDTSVDKQIKTIAYNRIFPTPENIRDTLLAGPGERMTITTARGEVDLDVNLDGSVDVGDIVALITGEVTEFPQATER